MCVGVCVAGSLTPKVECHYVLELGRGPGAGGRGGAQLHGLLASPGRSPAKDLFT